MNNQNLNSPHRFKSTPDWEDPKVFSRGQIKPHTPLVPFPDSKLAHNKSKKDSPFYLSLNGTWKFKWSPNPKKAPWDFRKKNYNTADWEEITVPSCWQMEGYGHPLFRNVAQTFRSDPPQVPEDYNPVGSYVHTFTLPDNWQEKKIFLHFCGVKSASYVYINGQEIGYNQGGMEPAEYEITDHLNPGKNKIAVQVLRYSDGTYLECQDMWRLSGIYRDVYLTAANPVHIHDYFVQTDLDHNYQNAELQLKFEIKNYSPDIIKNYQLSFQLQTPEGKSVFNKPIQKKLSSLFPQASQILNINKKIYNPQKWSAEKPQLYTLSFQLQDQQGNIREAYSKKIGFRKIEIKNQALYVNGVPVKLNGVNSHMHHPETGRSVDRETLKKDLTLMKQFNINCVRTSHYPPEPEYLNLADELGIYVIDETGNEAHATEYLSDDPEWKEQYLDRMRKMVFRDRNHPSVIIWSAGNESGWGDNLCALIKEGKKIDPSRPGWLYGGNRANDPQKNPIKCEDIVGPRYQKPFMLKHVFAKVPPEVDSRPVFMDEYLSAAGNGLGGLDEYWDLIRNYPRLTGGALWDWVSPGLKQKVRLIPDHAPFNICSALMGNPRLLETQNGKALSLEGRDQWVEIYRHPKLDISGRELTLDIKLKPGKWNGNGALITKGNHQFGLIQSSENELEFYVGGREKISLKVPIPTNWENNWHHLVGTYDGQKLKLYIENKLVGEKECKQKLLNTPYPVNIGRNAELHGQDYEGYLCQALMKRTVIFNKAFTPDELQNSNSELKKKALLWLEFDRVKKDGYFYSRGLEARTYGLIWPDRTIKPELWQVKKSGQPVQVELKDPQTGKLLIHNQHHFTNLSQLNVSWEVSNKGKQVLKNGQLQLNIAPGEKKEVTIDYDTEVINDKVNKNGSNFNTEIFKKETELFLLVQFRLVEDTSWASKDHEIAWSQFKLPTPKEKTISENTTENQSSKITTLTAEKTNREITIKGSNFNYIFDRKTGLIKSAQHQGQTLWTTGPKLNLWRPPLANELDYWCMGRTEIFPRKKELGNNVASMWYTTGLNKLKHELENFKIKKRKTGIKISTTSSLSANNYQTDFTVHYNYFIYPSGQLKLKTKVIPHGSQPAWLPKIGLQLQVPKKYQNIKWFGRGPFENYPDRKTGAKTGIYRSTIDKEHQPYLIPQDQGNKTMVKQLLLSDQNETGLLVESKDPFNFSTYKYHPENLTRASYSFQLKERDTITLNIDHQVSGVGGTAISVLNKYKVYPQPYEFELYFLNQPRQ